MAEKNGLGKKLAERLVSKKELTWDKLPKEMKQIFAFNEEYKIFLDNCKTERESIDEIIVAAKKKGFKSFTMASKSKLKPGDKIYVLNKNKNIALIVIGQEALEKGIKIIGSHLDSPRLDIKPNPLYESVDLALLKTHYYGGIKKYQWLSLPLALHGVVVKADGNKINIVIGENDGDPVFTITDLLPHLAKDQMEKKMREAISGEGLNILVGSIPIPDKEVKDRVKLALLDYLNKEYGLMEEDFISAELEAVPAGKARDIGFDRSLIASYGQDDRVCAFSSLKAIENIKDVEKTVMALFLDKEEIGSTGSTGAQGHFLENIIAEIVAAVNGEYSELVCRRTLANSKFISADVNAAIDPNYEEVMEKMNACKMGYGIVITKYTGSGGKYSANDADAEFVGEIRKLFNENKVIWQTGELGKVDQGGGGTIAQYIAKYTMDVLDCGVGLLGMHSTFEVASKADVYMAYKAYNVFFNN